MNNIRLADEKSVIKVFTDISNKSETTQTAITHLTKAGITEGTSETEFSPDKSVTRAEAAAMLLRMTGRKDEKSETDCKDATKDNWYYDTAGVSKKYGIVNGYEDNTFRGDKNISNLQLVSLAARVLREESIKSLSETGDTALQDIPSWAEKDVLLALSEGLIDNTDGILSSTVSRADTAEILYRLYDKV